MIGYITIGTNDLDKALAFYDDFLSGLGGKRVMETGNGYLYGFSKGALLGVTRPYDGQTQQRGNGNMVALSATSRDQVNTLHARALTLGGADDGAPGVRVGSFYGAYFRDLDGNKVCVYCMGD
jgi:catechol 2,3-dioxygenase-like lactoylglutathione lyase family enzyme